MGAFVQPQDNATEISAIVDQSKQLVQEKFTQALAYGDWASGLAEAFLATLSQAAGEGITPAHAPILTINPSLMGSTRGSSGKAGHRPYPPAPSGCAFLRGYLNRPPGDPDL